MARMFGPRAVTKREERMGAAFTTATKLCPSWSCGAAAGRLCLPAGWLRREPKVGPFVWDVSLEPRSTDPRGVRSVQ